MKQNRVFQAAVMVMLVIGFTSVAQAEMGKIGRHYTETLKGIVCNMEFRIDSRQAIFPGGEFDRLLNKNPEHVSCNVYGDFNRIERNIIERDIEKLKWRMHNLGYSNPKKPLDFYRERRHGWQNPFK